MKPFQFFLTGKFDAAELQGMRDKSNKSQALFEIGQRLREKRRALKLERSAVAAQCGVGADQLGRFEHGASDIGFQAFDRYCAVVGIDVLSLLMPHIGKDAEAALAVVDLARAWTGKGKALPIEEVIGGARAAKG